MSALDDAALITAAERALGQAYARYSGFQVGAVVLTKAGGLFTGCNIENVSYPLGACAERNAIAAAVLAEGPGMRILRMTVAAKSRGAIQPCAPCGACRQVILEFGPDAIVVFRGADLKFLEMSAPQLLPMAFTFAVERGS